MNIRNSFKNLKHWIQNKPISLKYWVQSINLRQWIKTNVTLKRQWYLYVLFLAIFIVAAICFREEFLFQVGVTLFSIAIVYLVMKQSNIELKETTENQINAFVINLQMVCSELRTVGGTIEALSVIMKGVQEIIRESSLVSKEAIVKVEREKRERKESIKPQLSIRLELKGFNFIIDLRGYHLIVTNSGSDAIGTVAKIGDWQSDSYDIRTYKSIDIDIGHIKRVRGIFLLNITIETRDVERNRYEGCVRASLSQLGQTFSVILTEI